MYKTGFEKNNNIYVCAMYIHVLRLVFVELLMMVETWKIRKKMSLKHEPEEVGHGSKGMLGRVVGSRSDVTNLRAVRTSRNDKFSPQKGRKSVNSAIYAISFLWLPLAHID